MAYTLRPQSRRKILKTANLKNFRDFANFGPKVADVDVIAYTYRPVSIRNPDQSIKIENLENVENLNPSERGVLRFLLIL